MADNTFERAPVAFQVLTEIGIISQLSNSALERVLPHRLTSSQFGVLSHFSRLGGSARPLHLANAFQVTKGAMTNTLQKLEKRGFVDISPDPVDGRAKLVKLTPAGSSAYGECITAVSPLIGQLMSEFDTEQFEKALPFLAELRAFVDKARD
jgi:DNA-binding MarR family transcriptional regulator